MNPAVTAAIAAVTAALAVNDIVDQVHTHRVRRRWPLGSTGAAVVPIPPWLARAFARAGVDDPQRAVTAWLGAVAIAAVLAAATAGGRLVLAAVVAGPPVALRLSSGRLARRRTRQLPDALDAVATGLRGGLGLAAAVDGAAAVGPPLGPELSSIGHAVRSGRPLDDALGRWRADHPDPATSLAGAALGVAAAVGGPGARAVDGAAASLRDRLAAEAEADALATQAKASAILLTAAPLVFAALLSTLDPAAGRFLLGTPVGWICVTAGLALDVAGAAWMSALVRRSR